MPKREQPKRVWRGKRSSRTRAVVRPADIFRADVQSQALLGQQGTKQRDKLAPSFKDPPAFIERKAASRAGKQQMD